MNLSVYTAMSVLAAAIVVGTGYNNAIQTVQAATINPHISKKPDVLTVTVASIVKSKFNILVQS
jgi:hypothetical protein